MDARLIPKAVALELLRRRLDALPADAPVTLYRDIEELPPLDGWRRWKPGRRFALVLPPDGSCVLAQA